MKKDTTNEVFYRHLAELSPDAIVIFSNGIIVYVNPTSVRLIGAKSQDELLGKPIVQFIHPDSQEVVVKRIKMMTRKQKVAPTVVEKIVDLKGNILIAEVKSVPFVFQGEPAILTILHNITERNMREKREDFLSRASEILMSSLDYKTTLKNIVQLIVPFVADYCRIAVLEENGNIQQVSFNHIDKKKTLLVEKLFNEYVGNKNASSGVGKILRTGKAEIISMITSDTVMSAHNDKITDIVTSLKLKSYMGIPLKARDKIIGAVTFSSSKEGRYYTKEDLTFVQELGTRIAFALDNAQLLANEQKAVRLRDDFLSVASHELKTPVTSLKAFTQVMQNRFARSGEKDHAEQLGKMDAQINKLTVLIQDLLDATKIQSGKLQLHMETYSLGELISEIVEEIQRTTKHPFVFKQSANTKLYGDRERIGQVLSNLLTNAIKYSPESKPIIIEIEEKKTELICSVQDFGIGISEYQIPFIFERFYREIGNRENTFPGLGLGLYISSEIISRHNGRIWVESEKGKGSRFYFSLPLR